MGWGGRIRSDFRELSFCVPCEPCLQLSLYPIIVETKVLFSAEKISSSVLCHVQCHLYPVPDIVKLDKLNSGLCAFLKPRPVFNYFVHKKG